MGRPTDADGCDDALADLLAAVADEYLARRAAGEDPDPTEFAARHPHAADDVRGALNLLRLAHTAPPPAVPAAGPPRELSDYRIVREVGRGGVGVVYEAVQLSLPRRVALKVFPFAALADPRHLQRFRNEAAAAASLDHPHVVKVYGVGQDRGVHFIALQFVDGRSLAELIADRRGGPAAGGPPASADPTAAARRDPTRPVNDTPAPGPAGSPPRCDPAYARRVAEWGAQAADALEHAHALGVVHRDVKPSNLLVDARGHLYVADFGLAKLGADAGLTGTGDVVGTARYMSPEQAAARHGLVDHRTDVYGLGATLFELLTLEPVHPGDDRADVLRRVTAGDPVAPGRLRGVPRPLATVVLKALAPDPARRYASAAELATDLRRFLADEPVRARPPSVGDRAGAWVRRNRRVVWAGAVMLAVVAVLSTTAAVTVWGQVVAREEAIRDKDDALTERDRLLGEKDRALAREAGALREKTDFAERAQRNLTRALDAANALAEMSDKLGGVGAYTDALRTHQKRVALWERLVADHPTEWDYRQSLGDAYLALCELQASRGRFLLAAQAASKSVGHWEQVRREFPDNTRFAGIPVATFHVGTAQEKLGLCLAQAGKHDQAAAAYRACLAEWDEFGRGLDPRARPALGHPRGCSRVSLGRLAAEQGRVDAAEAEFGAALEEVAELPPSMRPLRQIVAGLVAWGRADLLWVLGRGAEAQVAYRATFAALAEGESGPALQLEARATCPVVALRDPELVVSLARQATARSTSRVSDWRLAAAAYAIAGRRAEAEAALGRADGGWAPELFLLAKLCQNQGDGRAARKWYDDGVRWMEASNPSELTSRHLRAEAAEALGLLAPPPRLRAASAPGQVSPRMGAGVGSIALRQLSLLYRHDVPVRWAAFTNALGDGVRLVVGTQASGTQSPVTEVCAFPPFY